VNLPDEPASVLVDAHQVQRALVNLVENALKYSPAAEPVRVQVTDSAADATIRVIDHGPGVAPGERARIFEPFQRGASSDRPGAGLGLAIARGFAEANGGTLSVESRAGQGATFVLRFPVAESETVPA